MDVVVAGVVGAIPIVGAVPIVAASRNDGLNRGMMRSVRWPPGWRRRFLKSPPTMSFP